MELDKVCYTSIMSEGGEIDYNQRVDAEAARITEVMRAIEGRVRGMKEQGIQVPADEPTKFARLDQKASPEQRKIARSAIDTLIKVTTIKAQKEDVLAEEGDYKFTYNQGGIDVEVRIPNYQDEHIDAPSEKLSLRLDTWGRNDVKIDFDSRDKGVFQLGIVFAEPDGEDLINVLPYNSGEVNIGDMRVDEADLIQNFATEVADLLDPQYSCHPMTEFSSPPTRIPLS